MCGICGVWNYADSAPVDRAVLRQMTAALGHRGPDDEGFHFDDAAGLGLGFRRLSILDLTPAGRQPMPNEDGTVWVVANGEIYNFEALRDALAARGHVFRSRCDAEVIVHAYEEHGPECVAELNGMFGLAIWDAARRRLVLARDRVGEKPLYLYDDGRRLLFASELKALLAGATIRRELDWSAAAEFFAVGYVAGTRSILRGIAKLAPAHRLVLESGRAALTRYWDWLPAFRGERPLRRRRRRGALPVSRPARDGGGGPHPAALAAIRPARQTAAARRHGNRPTRGDPATAESGVLRPAARLDGWRAGRVRRRRAARSAHGGTRNFPRAGDRAAVAAAAPLRGPVDPRLDAPGLRTVVPCLPR